MDVARRMIGVAAIGVGSAVLFWSCYRNVGFWWALAATLVADVAMSTLGWWVRGPRDGSK